MAMPQHERTDQLAQAVQGMVGLGLTQEAIASTLDIDPKTLRKHYGPELQKGKASTNLQVAQMLFNKCKSGNVTAMIFWLKTQAGWKETQKIELSDDESGEELERARAKMARLLKSRGLSLDDVANEAAEASEPTGE